MYDKLWILFELLLFVLIGAALDLSNVLEVGVNGLLLILGLLIFRILGVLIANLSSDLNLKERLFVGISYIPKATVQASIASIPLSLGITNGNTMLTIGVLSILVTAPLGALLIKHTKKRLVL
ncbi:MAG: cation:proton antiporter [Firmicutes bacterium]|nr:cation:proton antiporter [Bacillota bacterium]